MPQWYPNKTDVQLGGFIQQQAALISSDFKVTVLYPHPIKNQDQEFDLEVTEYEGVKEIRVYYNQNEGILRRIKNYKRYKKALEIGLKEVQGNIDLCHLHVPMRSGLILESLNKNIPVVVTCHWSGHLNGGFNELPSTERKLYLNALERAKKITAVSEKLSVAVFKNTTHKSVVIPNIIVGNPTPYPSDKEGIRILTVGDLNNETKNYTRLLEFFSIALNEIDNLKLDIIGDGPDKALILDKILELGIGEKVNFLGRKTQQEVQDKYGDYHFFMNSSNSETFGMAIAEAIANGRPVVCTASGGPNDFVNDSNGKLVEVGDITSYVLALLEMCEKYTSYDPKELSKTILDKYGEEKLRDEWKSLYKSILQ